METVVMVYGCFGDECPVVIAEVQIKVMGSVMAMDWVA
jgi:hypothetical protein